MRIKEILAESRLDEKCWTGYRQAGTKKKGNRMVPNCVPNESIGEAANAAQQAAIAINMKKRKKHPKNEDVDLDENGLQRYTGIKKYGKKGFEALQKAGREGASEEEKGRIKDRYMTKEDITEDLELDADFDLIEEMVEDWAAHHGVDPDVIWEDLELVEDEDLLSEAEAWQTKKGKNKNGGLNKKGVASYRRSHPGSKLQTAVTTKPSKLKKGSKASKRRKSFCARMKGMKKHRAGAKTKRDPNSRINKALRKWHCESVEELQLMLENAQLWSEEYTGNITDVELRDVDPPDHHDDEEGVFVKNQLHTMIRVLTHLKNAIGDEEELPEWVKMKLSQAQGMIVGVMDYMISDKEQEVERQTGQDSLMKEAKATKQRLDPKCWAGHHKEGTKVKGGVRVNNCVPNKE